MGNQYSHDDKCFSQFIKKSKCTATCKGRTINNKNIFYEKFIIELYQKQLQNDTQNRPIDEWMILDQRRVVFISLIGLYQTWSLCPLSVLYSSIFILPLKRKWIYAPSKYQKEMKKTMFEDGIAFDNFLRLLQWKDHQNLVFWMFDDYKPENVQKNENDFTYVDNDLIAPFWKHLSNRLMTLFDPTTATNYKPLKLNDKWWKYSYGSLIKSRYNVQRHKILSELYFVTMKYKSIQEILYQSNPGSLIPIKAYDSFVLQDIVSPPKVKGFVSLKKDEADHYGFVQFSNGCCPDLNDGDDSNCGNEGEGVWMISTQYDENDLCDDSY